jgi:hypothetical protein
MTAMPPTKLTPLSLLFLILIVACSSTQNVPGDGSTIIRDGSSIEKAIIAKSISYEYDWVRMTYPNSQVTQQALVTKDRKRYDVLTVSTSSGEVKKIYFDVSSFYGKGL